MAKGYERSFSEQKFGGFHSIALSWNEERMEAQFFLMEELLEAYKRKNRNIFDSQKDIDQKAILALKFYIRTNNDYKGLYWKDIERVVHQEINSPSRYGFDIAWESQKEGDKIIISARTTRLLKERRRISNLEDDLLDENTEIPRNKYQEEKSYLKNMYLVLTKEIVPFSTQVLLNRYVETLRQEQELRIGEMLIKQEGIFLVEKKWWRRKRLVLVKWKSITYQFINEWVYFRDLYHLRTTKFLLHQSKISSKEAIEGLVKMGQQGKLF
jgi:hypothetical protein